MTTANNPLLFNAALAGYAGGMVAGWLFVDNTSGDYASVTAQATAWATALDAAIPADVTITTGGTAIAPTTGTIQEKETGKLGIIVVISQGAGFQRASGIPVGSSSFTASTFTSQAQAAAALYTSLIANLQTP